MDCNEIKPYTKPALNCGSQDITERPAKMASGHVEIRVYCTACSKDWIEYYKFDKLKKIKIKGI